MSTGTLKGSNLKKKPNTQKKVHKSKLNDEVSTCSMCSNLCVYITHGITLNMNNGRVRISYQRCTLL